ncbi:hypothetical protein PVT67_09355 [Gallaecimonas kandeliae]|uniref:hypothetical protein n=1 Tax=Gallaecimonas kandeliae TaxID=3029055 RepID=UPI0026473F3B|nr:hypothetical protein [Gallaecimonas kandeliae]WKE63907.1 hypothetical protein PVT67_09355 [Gallaecimonas kandeliae]
MTLLDFLKQLGSDAALAEAYKRDPKGVLAKTGLSDEEKDALLAGDTEQVKLLAGSDNVNMIDSIIVTYEE